MKNIVSIHQPSYFPWLGLVDKINKSDLFVLLDTVQLSDSAYQNRNLFLDNSGKETLITIPIMKKNHFSKTIKDIKISNDIWKKKHRKFIYFNYKKHPFFDEIYPKIDYIFDINSSFLIDYVAESMKIVMNLLNIDTDFIYASKLNLNDDLTKEDMVLNILENVNANIYLSGNGARSYQKEENFKNRNIELIYQDFKHPVYPQKNRDEFLYGMSSLDLLFNLGINASIKILGDI